MRLMNHHHHQHARRGSRPPPGLALQHVLPPHFSFRFFSFLFFFFSFLSYLFFPFFFFPLRQLHNWQWCFGPRLLSLPQGNQAGELAGMALAIGGEAGDIVAVRDPR